MVDTSLNTSNNVDFLPSHFFWMSNNATPSKTDTLLYGIVARRERNDDDGKPLPWHHSGLNYYEARERRTASSKRSCPVGICAADERRKHTFPTSGALVWHIAVKSVSQFVVVFFCYNLLLATSKPQIFSPVVGVAWNRRLGKTFSA